MLMMQQSGFSLRINICVMILEKPLMRPEVINGMII